MHPFACCLQTAADTECICLDRQTLGIAHDDKRFNLVTYNMCEFAFKVSG